MKQVTLNSAEKDYYQEHVGIHGSESNPDEHKPEKSRYINALRLIADNKFEAER